MKKPLRTERVDVDVILPLRTEVLRPEQAERGELARWDGDDLEGTEHYAGFGEDGEVLGCASYLETPMPDFLVAAGWRADASALRLRGMAITSACRNQGIGAWFMSDMLSDLALLKSPTRVVWCNAREAARSFYERAGFEVSGDPFDLPDIGPHYKMWRTLPMALA